MLNITESIKRIMNKKNKALRDKNLEKLSGGDKDQYKHNVLPDKVLFTPKNIICNMINPFSISINDTEKIEKYWGSLEEYKESIEKSPYFDGYDKDGFPIYKK